MVASCRVNRVISLSDTLPLLAKLLCFFILVTVIPWRRNEALTKDSPDARISPLMTLPFLSLPSQEYVTSFVALILAAIVIPYIIR